MENVSLSTKDLVRVSIFTALIAIGAYIAIPIGPVPITLQSFFILVSAVFLGRKAIYSTIVYIVLGIIGLPIFSSGVSGISKAFTPSFGFLIGMIVCSYVLGYIFEKYRDLSFSKVLAVFLLGSFILYLIGMPYMAAILNIYLDKGLSFNQILTSGMLLFLPGDILKSILAAMIYKRIK